MFSQRIENIGRTFKPLRVLKGLEPQIVFLCSGTIQVWQRTIDSAPLTIFAVAIDPVPMRGFLCAGEMLRGGVIWMISGRLPDALQLHFNKNSAWCQHLVSH